MRFCFYSGKGISEHINDKCHVTGLLGDPVRFGVDLGFSKDKIQFDEDQWCGCMYSWCCHGRFFRRTCRGSIW